MAWYMAAKKNGNIEKFTDRLKLVDWKPSTNCHGFFTKAFITDCQAVSEKANLLLWQLFVAVKTEKIPCTFNKSYS